MIGLLTNILYYHRISTTLVSPDKNKLGLTAILIPILGGLIVGLMAKFGSQMIRGHGIPEALDKILSSGSKMPPKIAILKPIASAISIGTGGPFGAEGPIIVTGGAVGSIFGQLFNFSGLQRRILLVAGASAGMSAVFGTPVASVLFGIEILMFEFKPRSIILISTASATADICRIGLSQLHLLAPQPLFLVKATEIDNIWVLVASIPLGIICGGASYIISKSVYWLEDLFSLLENRVDKTYWPIIGGFAIGIGGLIDSKALGVGYDTIDSMLLEKLTLTALILLFFTKLCIWSIGLGSGTSGGILAPVMIIGASLGGVFGYIIPVGSVAIWSLIGLTAVFAGVTRAPFTAIVFSIELTYNVGITPAAIIGTIIAYGISVLTLKRSVLSEKIGRRGYNFNFEMSTNPLDSITIKEIVQACQTVFTPETQVSKAKHYLINNPKAILQRLYPVVNSEGSVVGVTTVSSVLEHNFVSESQARNTDQIKADNNGYKSDTSVIRDIMIEDFKSLDLNDTLSKAADSIAEYEIGVIPILDESKSKQLVGLLTGFDILLARKAFVEDENLKNQSFSVLDRFGRWFSSDE
jgi:H+/Cl- antiporter ClcA/CBS domain-containing protein